jgi:hypothetical protein
MERHGASRVARQPGCAHHVTFRPALGPFRLRADVRDVTMSLSQDCLAIGIMNDIAEAASALGARR